ncbi:MAG TPA: TldD/PmbA family protein [Myxococcaceae bacterium]|nr:TldD/PmbA family protein [Myxococcaceae bacterium]
MKPDAPNLKGALDAALAAAKRLAPAGAALVRLESRRDANLRFARNEVTSSGDVDETTLSVEITLGQRHASSDTNQLDPASIEATVNRAIGMAQVAPEDPEVMPPLGPQHYLKAAPASDAPTAALDAATRAKMAREAMGLPSGEGLQMAGYLEHFSSRQLLGTSAGLRAEHQHTGANLSVTARTADGTGSGWAANVSHRIADVDPVKVGAVARDKALKSAKPTKLDPGRYTVVLEPAAVAELLSFMLFAMEAREADEGQSFFAKPGGGNKIGEQLFGPHVTISSPVGDPLLPLRPFDEDGLALSPTTWIDKGVVKALSYSRYWAKKQGKTPTGFPSSVLMAGGTATTEDLVKGVKKGVLITRFWYCQSVDPETLLTTGLTRDGVFLIEDGAVTRPVNNFRWNESPIQMLKNADALTRETYRVAGDFLPVRVPALRTNEFNLASISDAV